MIDLKTLAACEMRAKSDGLELEPIIFRLAMRYLALRKNIAEFRHFDLLIGDEDESSIDAAADRMIQEMMK